MRSNDPQNYSKSPHNMLDKLSSKINLIKADLTETVKERSRSMSSDRFNSITTVNTLINTNKVTFSLQDDTSSTTAQTKQNIAESDDTNSLPKLISSSKASTETSSSSQIVSQTTSNTDFMNSKTNTTKSSSSSMATTASLSSSLNSSGTAQTSTTASSHSRRKLRSIQDMSKLTDSTKYLNGGFKERLITKIDPVEMTVKPTIVMVPQDTVRRSAMLLAGPKFRLNSRVSKAKLKQHQDTVYSISICIGVISLVITLWKPISSCFSGFIVGCLFASVLVYIWFRMTINSKLEETAIEEWIDFPALDSMLAKVDKEDKNTYIQVTGAFMSFQSYDADRDDAFVRYPCDIRLDGYRLIIQLASKPWNDEKKSDKEVKFIGCREYLIKEARMMLVPEATLTRSKYWMNDYPIVIQDLQILDKQIYSKQQLEKSKFDASDFFKNNATILSIWFETGPQKEEWFHKLSLVLRKGKEEIERVKLLFAKNSETQPTSISNSFLNRRQAQTDADTMLLSNSVSEAHIQASVMETQTNAEELRQRIKEKEPKDVDKDASGTHRTIVRKSKALTPNEISLQKVLQTPECLDEVAITINFMTRRLLCDMFDTPVFKDLLKEKLEMKLREFSMPILDNLRVDSIELGNSFPIILKVEPMQWNTQGIWFNFFIYYRGNFKLSIKSRVVLQNLINNTLKHDRIRESQTYDHTQMHIHLSNESKVLKDKFHVVLMNIASNKYFQMFVNLPLVRTLFENFSRQEVGINVELTSFSGLLTLNIPPPPSDRVWLGFPEMPDLNVKVTPMYGAKQYSYILLQDFLEAKVRAEFKRIFVLPAMDDQLLSFFRDWVVDNVCNTTTKTTNQSVDNNNAKTNVPTVIREGLQENKTVRKIRRQYSDVTRNIS